MTEKQGRTSGKGCLASLAGFAAIVAVAGHFGHQGGGNVVVTNADKARLARQSEDAGTAATGEAVIRQMLKDPTSASFGAIDGRLRHGQHVACGSVNAKNSFGAFTGSRPWLVLIEKKVAMMAGVAQSARFSRFWNDYCVGPDDRAPKIPNEFLGITLGQRPPAQLRPFDQSRAVWVYRGEKPTSYLGVPITQAWFEAENGRLFGGEITAKGGAAYDRWRAALEARLGPSTSSDGRGQHPRLRWDGSERGLSAELYYNDRTDQTTTNVRRR